MTNERAIAGERDAIVYDLDGTLVDLDVNWDEVAADVTTTLDERGIETGGEDLWEILDRATERGVRAQVEDVIAEHERNGARASSYLALATRLVEEPRPVAICSLNCEGACRTALSEHDLVDHVEVVIGRDSVDAWKPDPEPLLAAVSALGVEPADAVFVGDSERDAITAERAGTGFRYVGDLA